MRTMYFLLFLACNSDGKINIGDSSSPTTGDASFTVTPESIVFDTLLVGQVSSQTLTVSNTGEPTLDLSAAMTGVPGGAYTTSFDTTTPAGGESAALTLSLAPSAWGSYDGTLQVSDAVSGNIVSIPVTAQVIEDNDGDGYGSTASGGDDCNDQDITINPGAGEVWYDGIDQNCDGLNDYDQDADGVEVDSDCDDTDPTAYPGATEIWYNGVDNACDGGDDYDQDLDGYTNDVDCVDTDASINPGVVDVWYDGIDSDCGGNNDYDQDGDGSEYPTDCNDLDGTIFPDATEVWYDGIDQNCDGANDFDQDADGYDYSIDCVDTDPTAYPGAADTWYDGVDSDCAGNSDYDQDTDGYDSSVYGGTDCNDLDAAFSPGVPEIWYDGIDQNCDGADDNDQDGDGYPVSTDCNDLSALAHPGATEIWYDGIDEDCSGGSDYDQDGDGTDYPTDCSDTDPNTTGPSPEVWDGLDNDCNGYPDDFVISSASAGVVYGSGASMQLGQNDALSIGGDIDGAGGDDIAIGTDSSGYGTVYIISGADMVGANGNADSYDSNNIVGNRELYYYYYYIYYYVGQLNGPQQDVTGDGTVDLLTSGLYNTAGYVYVFDDPMNSGDNYDASTTIAGDSGDDSTSKFATGDINGDGTLDLVIGSTTDSYTTGYWGGTYYTGNLAIFSGVPTGSNDMGDSTDQIHGQDQYDYLGGSVKIADWTGDGYADILAGATGVDDGASGGGALYLISGNSTLTWGSDQVESLDTLKISGTTANAALGGDALANPGDLNDDGAIDLVVGSETAGGVWIWWGGSLSGDTTVASAAASFTGTAGDFGASISYDVDYDGDGSLDLLIGDDGNDIGGTDAGALWFFSGGSWSGAYTAANADGVFWGAAAGENLGAGLSTGGDADGDGTSDLLVGAAGSDHSASDGGAVYLLLGR